MRNAERVQALGESDDVFLEVGFFLAAEEVDQGPGHGRVATDVIPDAYRGRSQCVVRADGAAAILGGHDRAVERIACSQRSQPADTLRQRRRCGQRAGAIVVLEHVRVIVGLEIAQQVVDRAAAARNQVGDTSSGNTPIPRPIENPV